jgi:hypothetical protein
MKTSKEMFYALKKLFESKNTSIAIALKHQLHNIKMTKADTISTFFMKIAEIRDQLGSIGEIISDRELVMLTLNVIPIIGSHSSRVLVDDLNCLSLIDYGQDCTQEETRLAVRGAHSSHND